MNTYHSILAVALLASFATAAQSIDVPLAQSSPAGNISGTGSMFTYVLPSSDGTHDKVLLSLDFKVSSNAAAQNDTISLFIGGIRQAWGQAASFSIVDLDVSAYLRETSTLEFTLFRDVLTGGGNIKLARSELRLVSMALGASGSTPPGEVGEKDLQQGIFFQTLDRPVGLQQIQPNPVPEPGTLALLGLGLLGMRMLRRHRC